MADRKEFSIICKTILDELFKSILGKNINLATEKNLFLIRIITPEICAYDKNVIAAVERTFKPYGWKCQMSFNKKFNRMNVIQWGYVFRFERMNLNLLYLPF